MRSSISPTNVGTALASGGYAGAVFWVTDRQGWDVGGALVVAPALVAISVPILLAVGRRDPDPRMPGLLVLALFAKLAGTLARYFVLQVVYSGGGDATRYDQAGKILFHGVRRGVIGTTSSPGGAATHHVEQVTGIVYAITGPTFVGGFLVFSWLGFWGAVLCTRAVRMAAPQVDAYRYSALLLFLPSVLFWPSSIGKESLALAGIGVCVYGAARVYTKRHLGYVTVAAGLGFLLLIRPNVAALVAAALIAGMALGRGERQVKAGRLRTVLALGVLAVAGYLVVTKAASSFGVNDLSVSGVQGTLDEAARRSTQGGSEFTPARVRTPLDLPWAAVTVLFRPLPYEAHNLQSLIASAEGTFLLLLSGWLVTRERWRRALRPALRNRLVVASFVFTLAFVLAFSSFGNFGILARERTQVLPFLLVPLTLGTTLVRPTTSSSRNSRAAHRPFERISA